MNLPESPHPNRPLHSAMLPRRFHPGQFHPPHSTRPIPPAPVPPAPIRQAAVATRSRFHADHCRGRRMGIWIREPVLQRLHQILPARSSQRSMSIKNRMPAEPPQTKKKRPVKHKVSRGGVQSGRQDGYRTFSLQFSRGTKSVIHDVQSTYVIG